MTVKKNLILIVIFIFSKIICQDIEYFEKLAVDGKMTELEKSLPFINSSFPNHPMTQYINAAMNNNGEEAFIQFNTIINNFPTKTAGELSIMKIGEYLYSKGFYSQAIEQLIKIPLFFSKSKNIERSVDLLKKSYLSIGQQDSSEFYVNKFSEIYPALNFKNYNFTYQDFLDDKNKSIQSEQKVDEKSTSVQNSTSWIVQVGAFSIKKNAETIQNRLVSAGYNAIIVIVERVGKRKLHLVQIVKMTTLENAIITGERIKNQFGLDFVIHKK